MRYISVYEPAQHLDALQQQLEEEILHWSELIARVNRVLKTSSDLVGRTRRRRSQRDSERKRSQPFGA